MTAAVQVVLDTRAPVLTVLAPRVVEPPDHWVVSVVSDEDMGSAAVALLDSLGSMTVVGYQRTGSRELEVSLPTVGIATGPCTLLLRVEDVVGNATRTTVGVLVDRPRVYDVSLGISGAYEVDTAMSEAYGVALDFSPAYNVSLEVSDG